MPNLFVAGRWNYDKIAEKRKASSNKKKKRNDKHLMSRSEQKNIIRVQNEKREQPFIMY